MKGLQAKQNVIIRYQGKNDGTGYHGSIIRNHGESYDIELASQPYGIKFLVPQEIVFPLGGETLYHVVSFDLTRKDFSKLCCVLFTSESMLQAEKFCQRVRKNAYRKEDNQHLHFVHKYIDGLKVKY